MPRLGLFSVQRAAVASPNKLIKYILIAISCFAMLVCLVRQGILVQLPNLRGLITVHDDLTDLTVVPKICPPPKALTSKECPKVACVPSRSAGLGHRLTNVLQGYILAQALGVSPAGPRLYTPGHPTRPYTGVNELFRDENEIVECPGRGKPIPYGWKSREFYADGTLERTIHFGENVSTSVNNLPFGHHNPAFTQAEDDGCEALAYARKVVEDAPCYTFFTVNEFWPTTYLSSHEALRYLYKGYDPKVRESLLTKNLIDDRKFNLAFHIRDGDKVTNTIDYFTGILSTILEEISTLEIEVKVLVFSEHVENYLEAMEDTAAKASTVNVEVVDGGDLSPLETFMHFLSAQVFVGSDSSFSSTANMIAGATQQPVVITSPDKIGRIETNYVPGSLIGNLNGTYTNYGRIYIAAHAWKRYHTYNSALQETSVS